MSIACAVTPNLCIPCRVGRPYLSMPIWSSNAVASCRGGPLFLDGISGRIRVVPGVTISMGICVPTWDFRRGRRHRAPSCPGRRMFKIETPEDICSGNTLWPADLDGLLLVLVFWCGGRFSEATSPTGTPLSLLSPFLAKLSRIFQHFQGRSPSRCTGTR